MELAKIIESEFLSRFSQIPTIIKSPGRVNLIGEHTDYNDGFVLPAAIQKNIVMAMAPNNSELVNVYSVDMEESATFDLSKPLKSSDKHWTNYIKGAISEVQNTGLRPKGFDCVFGGDIPIGSGLSSSAALEGAVLFGMNALFNLGMQPAQMARLGQLANPQRDITAEYSAGLLRELPEIHFKKARL